MLAAGLAERRSQVIKAPFHGGSGSLPHHRFGGFNAAAHGLRGLASLLVLGAHILGGTARHIYPDNTAYVRAVLHPWCLGTFGVELFFVISGFVILPSACKYRPGEFALRRFVRIYPLFLVLSLVFIGLNALTASYAHLNNARSIVSGLLFINLFTGTEQLTPNAWSLSYEVVFYVLTAAVVCLAIKRRCRWAGAAAIGVAIAFLLVFPISTYFLIGIALSVALPRTPPAGSASRVIELLALMSLVWFASRDHFDYASWQQFQTPVVPLILLSISVYFLQALRRGSLTALVLDNTIFRYVGDVSYSLYLVHPFIYFILRMVFVHFGWFTDDIALSMSLFAIAVFLGSFLATHPVHAILERELYEAIFRERVFHSEAGKALQSGVA